MRSAKSPWERKLTEGRSPEAETGSAVYWVWSGSLDSNEGPETDDPAQFRCFHFRKGRADSATEDSCARLWLVIAPQYWALIGWQSQVQARLCFANCSPCGTRAAPWEVQGQCRLWRVKLGKLSGGGWVMNTAWTLGWLLELRGFREY